MNEDVFFVIDKYAKELAAVEGAGEGFLKILAELNGQLVQTRDGAAFERLRREDVLAAEQAADLYPVEYRLLKEESEIRAVVLSQTPYCRAAAVSEQPLTAALDDMAQIVGYQVFIAEYGEESVREALREASGCFVRDRYTLTAGRSLYEAVIALQVLEKSAEVNQKAGVLGGAKYIPQEEARRMRRNYRENYSRQEQQIKRREERQR